MSSATQSAAVKILLVEDEPTLIRLYSVALKSVGTVDAVSNAADAIHYLNDHLSKPPQVVLLDLIIPEKPGVPLDFSERWGFHVLEALQQHSEYKVVPVLVMTNLDSTEDRKRAAGLGAKAYIVKSNVIPRQIIQLIQNSL